MKLAKQLGGFVVTAFEAHWAGIGIFFLGGEIRQHVLGRHVSGEVVFRHGAAAKTLNGTVIAAATGLVRGVDFLKPFIGSGVQVSPELDVGVFWN